MKMHSKRSVAFFVASLCFAFNDMHVASLWMAFIACLLWSYDK